MTALGAKSSSLSLHHRCQLPHLATHQLSTSVAPPVTELLPTLKAK